MYSYISVPASRVPSAAATPSANSTVASESNEQIMETIEQLDLFRMTQELVDRVAEGRVQAKDVHNEAGPIRVKIAKVKQGLQNLEGLNEDLPERLAKIEELQYRVSRKRQLLQHFQQVMGITNTGVDVEKNNNSSSSGDIGDKPPTVVDEDTEKKEEGQQTVSTEEEEKPGEIKGEQKADTEIKDEKNADTQVKDEEQLNLAEEEAKNDTNGGTEPMELE